jgi:hypothetical protein
MDNVQSRRNFLKLGATAVGVLAASKITHLDAAVQDQSTHPIKEPMSQMDRKAYSALIQQGNLVDVLGRYRSNWNHYQLDSIAEEIMGKDSGLLAVANHAALSAKKPGDKHWKKYSENMYSALAGINRIMKDGYGNLADKAKAVAGNQDLAAIVQNVNDAAKPDPKETYVVRIGNYWIFAGEVDVSSKSNSSSDGGVVADVKILYGDKEGKAPAFKTGYDFGRINLNGMKVKDLFKKVDNLNER